MLPRVFLLFAVVTLLIAFALKLAIVACDAREKERYQEAASAPTTPAATSSSVPDIDAVFQRLFMRDPTAAELTFWESYIGSRGTVTQDQLFDVVSYSPNTVLSDSPLYGTENLVILTFNNVLDRNPNRLELRQYASLLRQSAGPDVMSSNDEAVMRLTRILLASSEFIRMEKTQQNRVFSTLPGDFTDRQLTMAVTSIYAQLPNAPAMDDDTMRFLKKKLIAFNLDPLRFKAFIAQYVTDVGQATVADSDTVTAANVKSIIDLNLRSDDDDVRSAAQSAASRAQASETHADDTPVVFTDLSPPDAPTHNPVAPQVPVLRTQAGPAAGCDSAVAGHDLTMIT